MFRISTLIGARARQFLHPLAGRGGSQYWRGNNAHKSGRSQQLYIKITFSLALIIDARVIERVVAVVVVVTLVVACEFGDEMYDEVYSKKRGSFLSN